MSTQKRPERDSEEPRQGDPSSLIERIANLPPHLGWGSAAGSRAIRDALARRAAREAQSREADRPWWERLGEEPTEAAAEVPEGDEPEGTHPKEEAHRNDSGPSAAGDRPATGDLAQLTRRALRLYPDLGLAILSQKRSAAGRVWLLLRFLDQERHQGRGWLALAEVRRLLTASDSPWRLFTPRRLRQLLRQGAGCFWRRDPTRGWLRSATQVAACLGVKKLTVRAVAVPVAALLGSMQSARAELYAAFHSGRVKERHGRVHAAPIARQTLTALSGLSARTQAAYERRARIKTRANLALGERYSRERLEERAWQKGRALFLLTDHLGCQGEAGARFLAWRLPNSYFCGHLPLNRGRMKWINRELADLQSRGAGNGRGLESAPPGGRGRERTYYASGVEAGRALKRGEVHEEVYWPLIGRSCLWQVWS